MDCIFCKIAAGEIPSDILYRDDVVIAFRDINPVAPTHLLIIPVKHIPAVTDLSGEDTSIIGYMVNVANQLAKSEHVAADGYRLVINCGQYGGQLVPHLHMHLIGGRKLTNTIG